MKRVRNILRNRSFRFALVLGLCAGLTACDNTSVYGSVSVGSSWGGYGHPGSRMTIGVSGRVR